MPTLDEIRQKYPQYHDLSDQQLSDALYNKYYSDIPRQEFDRKIRPSRFDEATPAPREPSQLQAALEERARAETDNGVMDAIGKGIGQGASFGFADEIAAKLNAAPGRVGKPGYDPNETRSLSKIRADFKSAEQHHPVAYTVGQIAGMIPGAGVGAAKGIAQGATMLGKMGRGALSGSMLGGLFGLGTSDEPTLEERLPDAARGAVGGGVVGAVAPPAGAMIGKLASKAVEKVPMLLRKETPGIGRVAQAFERDAVDPALVKALGEDAMLLDAGPNLLQKGAQIAATPGEGQAIIRDAIAARQGGAGPRVQTAVDQSLGSRVNIPQNIDQLIQQRETAARPLYQQAYTVPIQITPAMKAQLDTPAGQQALKNAMKLAANEGQKIDPANLDTRAIDYVKRALDDMIGGAQTTRATQESRALTNIKNTLVSELDAQNPTFAKARQAYAGPSGVMDALEAGQGVFRRAITPDELRVELAGMSQAERAAFQKGARAQIEEIMGTARNDAGAAYRELSDKGWNREKLELVVGKQNADRLLTALGAEKTFADTATRVTRNSETAARLSAMAEDAGSDVLAKGKDAFVYGGFTGPARYAAMSAIDKALAGLSGASREKRNAVVADLLTKTGSDRDALVQALMDRRAHMRSGTAKAQAAQKLIEALATSTGIAGGATTSPPLVEGAQRRLLPQD